MLQSRSRWFALAFAASVLVLTLLGIALTSSGERTRTAGVLPPLEAALASQSSAATPEPPRVTFDPLPPAHQGLPYTISGRVNSPTPGALFATLEIGDRSLPLPVEPDGSFAVTHTFTGTKTTALQATAEGPTGSRTTTGRVEVVPRKVVFLQGMNSESGCPSGKHFLDRAPRWLASYFDGDGSFRDHLALAPDAFAYFSYSGRYCDGSNGSLGAAPDYGKGDTCTSIASDAAPRLKALIDSLAPSRVTVVAHSMGGLVTAYLVATEPEWAREHLVSVATFDSPLGGIDSFRSGVLSLFRVAIDGCGRSTPAMGELQSGSSVTRVAATAGSIVPFFTLDGEAGEAHVFGAAEAVPGKSTRMAGSILHMQVAEEHSEVWSRAPGNDAILDKRTFVGCAVLVDASACVAGS